MALARAVIALGDQGKGTLSKVEGFRAEMSRSESALSGIQTKTTEGTSALRAVADSRRELERAHEALTEFAPHAHAFARFLASGAGASGKGAAGSAAMAATAVAAAADADGTGNAGVTANLGEAARRGLEVHEIIAKKGKQELVSLVERRNNIREDYARKVEDMWREAVDPYLNEYNFISKKMEVKGWAGVAWRLVGRSLHPIFLALAIRQMGTVLEAISNSREMSRQVGSAIHLVEHLGERGGEIYLWKNNYWIPPMFRSNADRGPGSYHIDGLALSADGSRIVVAEYKGGEGRIDKTERPLWKLGGAKAKREGVTAAQATPRYALDRMLSDERVAAFFKESPLLWKKVKAGEVRLGVAVYETPFDLATKVSHEADIPMDEWFVKFVNGMDDLIGELEGGR